MSDQENGKAECPFSGHGEEVINVKFFRGTRNDVITAGEINEQVRSARMQRKLKTATVSASAPVSQHSAINVRDFVAAL
jgi:hypothetical protein